MARAVRVYFGMSSLVLQRIIFGPVQAPDGAVDALLVRMRERLYPETLPVLASCWLKTLCCGGHNRAWWLQLQESLDRSVAAEDLAPFAREVLLSTREWTARALTGGAEALAGRSQLEPPFRSLPHDHLAVYVGRLLNEWLPTEVAHLLTQEDDAGSLPDDGIPALALAKALNGLLVRERLSPETLELFLAPELLSPRLIYPADAEVLRDVVLALLGRLTAPPMPVLPAVLLGVAGDSALPPGFEDALRAATLEGEELHVPITESDAAAMLRHDPVRMGSVVVTMDGRAWLPWTLHRGERNQIVYRPGERLRIDCTADHAKLTVSWPETPTSWGGALPQRGPFELFGREWRAASWEMNGEATTLHLTFSRVLPIGEAPARATAEGRVQPANVTMGWSELERALAEAVLRKSAAPIEEMRRTELIPLGRAAYAFTESSLNKWRWNAKQVETQLRAMRYHLGAIEAVYGRAPWRILPPAAQESLGKKRLTAEAAALLAEIFADIPGASGQAA